MRVDVTNLGGALLRLKKEELIELRDQLISTPGLTTKPVKERTALENLAITLVRAADKVDPPKKNK